MQQLEKIYEYLKKILLSFRKDHISAFAAYSAFFLMLSFLPMLVLVFTVSNIFGVDLINIISSFNVNNPYLNRIITHSALSSTAVISVSTIFTAWSAGRAFHALIEGFNVILKVDSKKNYILLRFRSLLISLIFALVFVGIIVIGIFSDKIYQFIVNNYLFQFDSILFGVWRAFFAISVLFVILLIAYRFTPDWQSWYAKSNSKKERMLPGVVSSALTSVTIYAFAHVFYLYVDLFANIPKYYGSMSALAIVMLWIYGSLYVVLAGFKLTVHLNKK